MVYPNSIPAPRKTRNGLLRNINTPTRHMTVSSGEGERHGPYEVSCKRPVRRGEVELGRPSPSLSGAYLVFRPSTRPAPWPGRMYAVAWDADDE